MSSPNAGSEADYIEQKMPVEPEEPLELRTPEESLADEVPTADALEQAQDARPSDDETQWPREA